MSNHEIHKSNSSDKNSRRHSYYVPSTVHQRPHAVPEFTSRNMSNHEIHKSNSSDKNSRQHSYYDPSRVQQRPHVHRNSGHYGPTAEYQEPKESSSGNEVNPSERDSWNVSNMPEIIKNIARFEDSLYNIFKNPKAVNLIRLTQSKKALKELKFTDESSKKLADYLVDKIEVLLTHLESHNKSSTAELEHPEIKSIEFKILQYEENLQQLSPDACLEGFQGLENDLKDLTKFNVNDNLRQQTITKLNNVRKLLRDKYAELVENFVEMCTNDFSQMYPGHCPDHIQDAQNHLNCLEQLYVDDNYNKQYKQEILQKLNSLRTKLWEKYEASKDPVIRKIIDENSKPLRDLSDTHSNDFLKMLKNLESDLNTLTMLNKNVNDEFNKNLRVEWKQELNRRKQYIEGKHQESGWPVVQEIIHNINEKYQSNITQLTSGEINDQDYLTFKTSLQKDMDKLKILTTNNISVLQWKPKLINKLEEIIKHVSAHAQGSENIQKVAQKINSYKERVENFDGEKTDTEYYYLDEDLRNDILEIKNLQSKQKKSVIDSLQELRENLRLKADPPVKCEEDLINNMRRKINIVLRKTQALKCELQEFCGDTAHKDFYYFDESLKKFMAELDKLDSLEYPSIKEEKGEVIRLINELQRELKVKVDSTTK